MIGKTVRETLRPDVVGKIIREDGDAWVIELNNSVRSAAIYDIRGHIADEFWPKGHHIAIRKYMVREVQISNVR
jgi:hypothetical protein